MQIRVSKFGEQKKGNGRGYIQTTTTTQRKTHLRTLVNVASKQLDSL